jgi:DNA repair exonuclease SbcCD ATPase subunit
MLEPKSLKDILIKQQQSGAIADEPSHVVDIDLCEEIEMECSAALIFEENINPADIFSEITKNKGNIKDVKVHKSDNDVKDIENPLMIKLKSLEALNSSITRELESSKLDQNNKAMKIKMLLQEEKEKDNEISRLRLELKETLLSQSIINSNLTNKDTLQDELVKLTTEFHELQNANQDLERKLQISLSESQKLKFDNTSLIEESKGYMTELNKVSIELNQSKTECGILKSENIYLKEEINKIKSNVDVSKSQLETRLKDAEMDKFRLEEQLKGLYLYFNNKNAMAARANDDIMIMERRMTQIEAENSNLKYKLSGLEMIERDFSTAKRHIASLEAELTNIMIENNRLRAISNSNHLENMGHSTFLSRPSYSKVSFSSYADPEQIHTSNVQDSTKSMSPTVFNQFQPQSTSFQQPQPTSFQQPQPTSFQQPQPVQFQPQSRSDQFKSSMEHVVDQLPSQPNLKPITNVAQNVNIDANVNKDISNSEDSELMYTNAPRRSSSRQSIGSLLQTQNIKVKYEESKPPTIEPVQNSNSIASTYINQSISSNGTPFATEQSAAEISKVYADIDKKLTSLMTERTALHEECEKLHQRGGKTLKERTRLTEVELRLSELNKEISSARKSLTSKPS